jgi:hypothetical protein
LWRAGRPKGRPALFVIVAGLRAVQRVQGWGEGFALVEPLVGAYNSLNETQTNRQTTNSLDFLKGDHHERCTHPE